MSERAADGRAGVVAVAGEALVDFVPAGGDGVFRAAPGGSPANVAVGLARRAVGVMPDPLPDNAPVARVTLTRAAILSARTILITITGDKKREVLEQAIADGQSSRVPIGRVLAEAEQPIDIHWAP